MQTPESKHTFWYQLSGGLFLLSLALMILVNPFGLSTESLFGQNSYVFRKGTFVSAQSELNHYPPLVDRAAPLVDKRVEPLREYLASKNSPLAPYADVLVEHYHYRLIIGISFAESNFCKQNIKPHNCWGIGGGRPATYPDYPHAISRADYYIQKYFDDGLTDLNTFRNRWVGWQHPGWPIAVERVARELEEKGI